MMRREAILGTGLLLASIAEIQFAVTFLGSSSAIEAACTFAAGAGLLLASVGAFFAEARGWTLTIGLAVAAAAHVAYLAVSSADFGVGPYGMLVIASTLVAGGLVGAAWGARSGVPDTRLVRVGFALAALGAVVWLLNDVQDAQSFIVGDVFAAIGFATAAWFVAREVVAS